MVLHTLLQKEENKASVCFSHDTVSALLTSAEHLQTSSTASTSSTAIVLPHLAPQASQTGIKGGSDPIPGTGNTKNILEQDNQELKQKHPERCVCAS